MCLDEGTVWCVWVGDAVWVCLSRGYRLCVCVCVSGRLRVGVSGETE